MQWVIQDDVFDEGYLCHVTKTLDNLELDYHIIKYIPWSDGEYLPEITDNQAIVYGSINLLKQTQQSTEWVPSAVVTWKNYEVVTYLNIYDKYLLNRDGTFMLLDVLRQRAVEMIKKTMFIKPNAGDKIWAGGEYTAEGCLKEASKIEDENPLMYLSQPRLIEVEWRIFCVDGQIVTGSQYRKDGKKDVDKYVPPEVNLFVQEVLNNVGWQPDPVYTLDIGYCNEKFYIVEPSPFNCAGFYTCDIPKLITTVHQYYNGL